MQDPEASRLETELSLLQQIYPDQVNLDARRSELTFTLPAHAKLVLRIPSDYPSSILPTIISATASNGSDLRDAVSSDLKALDAGSEILDVIFDNFTGLVEREDRDSTAVGDTSPASECASKSGALNDTSGKPSHLTVIIWTHHLLATSKRKLILDVPSSISGLSKPGYPGVIIYSGEAIEVREQVKLLRAQNWQAFQVRLEIEELWQFEHGARVREVESMGDVVAGIVDDQGHERSMKETVLNVLKIK